ALVKQAPREIVNRPKHLVAFPLATGFDLGLLASARPRGTQRAPLRKAGFILKQDQALPTLGSTQELWPVLLEPGVPTRGVEMIRHKAGLLERKPQVVQQRTHILTVVEHTELAPDQHSNEDRIPTGRLTAHGERTGVNQLHQAFLRAGGQLRAAT